MRSSAQKTLALWAFLVVAAFLLYQGLESPGRSYIRDYNFSKFVASLENKEIVDTSLVFRQDSSEISGQIKPEYESKYDGKYFTIVGNTGDETFKLAKSHGVIPNYEKSESNSLFFTVLVNWLPILLIIGMFMFLLRQIQVGGGKAMSFGKSRAKLLTENKNKVTFKDVAGVEEAKGDLEEIVSFLKDPKKYTKLGGRIPKGVLLVGPPGTGKTLLARAVAGEAGVPFFTISGSDFVEMFVGVGASRVRDLFEQGKRNAPCLIFIDEIDAVGRHRGAGMGGGHDEREQTLNQLLVEMDGFESNEGVILIAATNRPDVLDPALLRPGRFDRRVIVNKPDLGGREQILKVHARRTPLGSDVDLAKVARGTPGFSGADLENLVNEAALQAARTGKGKLQMEDFEKAKDRVMMGAERKSMVISDEDKRITAYHEAGHTLVGKKVPGSDPIHKVTIIPRGMALGLTQFLPEEDRLNLSVSKAKGMIAMMYGGRVAEELIFQDFTTGASNDIERATEVARKMVCEWGMSENLGPLTYEKGEGPVFLGMQYSQKSREYSDAKAEEIDKEVLRIIKEGYDRAKDILENNLQVLHNLAEALLEYETIDADEVESIVAGSSLDEVREERKKRMDALEVEAKEAGESAEEKEKKKNESDDKDPVGNPGPVTA